MKIRLIGISLGALALCATTRAQTMTFESAQAALTPLLAQAKAFFDRAPAPKTIARDLGALETGGARLPPGSAQVIEQIKALPKMPENATPQQLMAFMNSPAYRAFLKSQMSRGDANQTDLSRTRAFIAQNKIGSIKGWRGRAVLWQSGSGSPTNLNSKLSGRGDLVVICDFVTSRRWFDSSQRAQKWSGAYTLRVASSFSRAPGEARSLDSLIAPRTIERSDPAAVQIAASHRGLQIAFNGVKVNGAVLTQPDVNGFLVGQSALSSSRRDDDTFYPWSGTGFKTLRGDVISKSPTNNSTDNLRIAWELTAF